ncbi:WbqC family protein [Winogradskyella litorisediminis]|uniref:WbqC family protein n=1 Tax=Winogradskyella litorisediminis TaxID=1156618 RepID=A0ABW3NAG3_9FLAO
MKFSTALEQIDITITMSLIHPTYFPNIAHISAIVSETKLVFEVCDNYQKQTFRNRTEIYGANGKLALTVPVSYTQKNRQQYKDVRISKTENWQSQHLKSLDSAYKMSPFYEFYIDDLMPLFIEEFDFLLDVNLKCFELLSDCLEIAIPFTLTEEFIHPKEADNDFRSLANAKIASEFSFDNYTQVFTEKHGFLSNLSVLDVLFNEGPNAMNYLTSQKEKL